MPVRVSADAGVQVRTPLADRLPQLHEAALDLAPGLTAVVGANGQGKTNLLEALGWLATLSSFRGAPTDALVRRGAPTPSCGPTAERDGPRAAHRGRAAAGGRNRVQVNRQPLRRARDLLGALRVTVFSPDDLALVKGGPASGGATSTTCSWRCTPATTRCGPRSTGSCASATPCCGRRAGGSTRAAAHARRVGRQAGGLRAAPRPRPRLDLVDAAAARAVGDLRRRRPPPADVTASTRPRGRPRRRRGPDRQAALTAPGGGPGGARRRAPGRVDRRAAPRRAGAGDRRPARPAPRPPGRAAVAGAGAAAGRPPTWSPTCRARRRSCCSTTCSASSTPTAATPLLAHLPAARRC